MRTRHRRLVAGLAGAAVLVGVCGAPTTQVTEAAFTDREAGTATITAFRVPAPTITACTITNNGAGMFQNVRLVWTSPYGATGVRLTLSQGTTTDTVPAGSISTTGPVNGLYTHTAVLNQSLLVSLISNLFGSTTTMRVTNLLSGTSWVSVAATRQLTIAFAGTGATCT